MFFTHWEKMLKNLTIVTSENIQKDALFLKTNNDQERDVLLLNVNLSENESNNIIKSYLTKEKPAAKEKSLTN